MPGIMLPVVIVGAILISSAIVLGIIVFLSRKKKSKDPTGRPILGAPKSPPKTPKSPPKTPKSPPKNTTPIINPIEKPETPKSPLKNPPPIINPIVNPENPATILNLNKNPTPPKSPPKNPPPIINPIVNPENPPPIINPIVNPENNKDLDDEKELEKLNKEISEYNSTLAEKNALLKEEQERRNRLLEEIEKHKKEFDECKTLCENSKQLEIDNQRLKDEIKKLRNIIQISDKYTKETDYLSRIKQIKKLFETKEMIMKLNDNIKYLEEDKMDNINDFLSKHKEFKQHFDFKPLFPQMKYKYENIEKEHQILPNSRIHKISHEYLLTILQKENNKIAVPYPYNMVKAGEDSLPETNFYASKITKNNTNFYLAANVPSVESMNNFWNLVCIENVTSIVLLTYEEDKFIELGNLYFPTDASKKYANIEVSVKDTQDYAHFIIHELIVKKKDEKDRRVTQFNFLSWNDEILPINYISLLEFRNKINEHQGNSIILSKNGAGRVGTFIAIDYLLEVKKHDHFLPQESVFNCVNNLRQQRMNMVQNLQQYLFIYFVLNESHSFKIYERYNNSNFLSHDHDEDAESLLESLNCVRYFPLTSPENIKNIYDICHHCYDITKNEKTFLIDGIKLQNRFIIPHPMKIIDPEAFIEILFDTKVDAVIMLNDEKELRALKLDKYWKDDFKIGEYECTKEKLLYTKKDITYQKCKITNKSTSLSVSLYSFSEEDWPIGSDVPKNIIKDILDTFVGRLLFFCVNDGDREEFASTAFKIYESPEKIENFALKCRHVIEANPQYLQSKQMLLSLIKIIKPVPHEAPKTA